MKRILLFTVFLTSASVSWADEGSSCDDNINWTAVSAIANIILAIVALLALGWTWKEIKLMHSNSKADLYARYRSRFNINQDLRIVEKFIDIKKNRIIHNHEWPTPDDHQLVVFMQYYQEIGFLIEKGRIDKDMLIGLNPKYLHTALSLYHKLGIDYTVRAYGRMNPIVIFGGDFINLVVPMRISEGRDKESIVKEYAA